MQAKIYEDPNIVNNNYNFKQGQDEEYIPNKEGILSRLRIP